MFRYYSANGQRRRFHGAYDMAGKSLPKGAAPLMKYAERLFSRPAFIEALTPSEKVMRK